MEKKQPGVQMIEFKNLQTMSKRELISTFKHEVERLEDLIKYLSVSLDIYKKTCGIEQKDYVLINPSWLNDFTGGDMDLRMKQHKGYKFCSTLSDGQQLWIKDKDDK